MKKLLLAAVASIPLVTLAAEMEVDQKGNNFAQKSLRIRAGDTIAFKNSDAHFHNVFSLTAGHDFDLGSHGHGQIRKHTFKKPGKVDIECAIHPNMKLTVEVNP
jgi:plastocyanin